MLVPFIHGYTRNCDISICIYMFLQAKFSSFSNEKVLLDKKLYQHPYLHKVHIVHSVKMIARKYQYMLNILVLGILHDNLDTITPFIQIFSNIYMIVIAYLKDPYELPHSISCPLEPFFSCFSRCLSSSQDLL